MELDFNKQPEGSYELCPAGAHNAVCVDVIDKGWETTEWEGQSKTQPKITLVFQTEARDSMARRFRRYADLTVSTHEKSNMVKFLTSWIGEELKNGVFQMESLIGRQALLTITHKKSAISGKTFAKITNISPPHPKDDPLEIEDYVRKQDTEDYEAPSPSAFEPYNADGAPAPTPAPAPAPTPAATTAAPAAPPQATQGEPYAAPDVAPAAEVDEFLAFVEENFELAFASKKMDEIIYQIARHKDLRKLTSTQLGILRFQMQSLDSKYWKVKGQFKPTTPAPAAPSIDEEEDPFADE